MGSANLSLCLYFALYNAAYASNYLLALFMGNLFLYLNYYVFMKLYCGERPTWTCLTYAALLHLTSIPSLYFFLKVQRLDIPTHTWLCYTCLQAEKNSDLSPAESRHLNQACCFLDFYDFHDIWHFLGGFGVFFTYMFLLTIDEDVKYKRRDQLRVF